MKKFGLISFILFCVLGQSRSQVRPVNSVRYRLISQRDLRSLNIEQLRNTLIQRNTRHEAFNTPLEQKQKQQLKRKARREARRSR